MNRNSKKSSIVTTVVVLLVCLVLVTGSTFSLFTSKNEVNIAVTSGSVDVKAIIDSDSLNVWSRGETETENSGSFANDGSSAYINEEGKLVLANIVPGDNAAVTVDVTNDSTVAVAYRLVLTINGPLAEALDISIETPAGEFNYGYTQWITVAAEEEIGDIKVKISFPENAGNEYQGLECSISFVLEAIQGNGDFVDPITYNETTGVYEVNSEEGMMLMSNIINTVSHGEGRSLKFALTADMDMTDYDWTPVRLHWVDVDGQGHTVSNLNCGSDDWGRSGFAGYVGGGNISNLTLENVTAVGTQVGVVAGSFDGGSVSNVTIKGTNSVKYDYAVNPEETWGGAGAIAGVACYLSSNSSVVIADGATISVDYNGLVTGAPMQDEYSFIESIASVVTNNGTVTTTDTPVIVENGLQMVYGENGEKTLYLVPADYAQDTVNIPEGVTTIGNYAFAYNNNVKTVILASTVRDLGRGFDSSKVEKVVLNEGLTTISSRAFKGTTALKEVVISSTVTTIADNAFQKSGIKGITIPANVKTVGETAFGASLIEKVTFEGNTNIEAYAFRGCTKLNTVILNGMDVNFVNSTLNGRNNCWFCNGESNNPNTSNITFYVKTDVIKERVLTAMGAERNNTTVFVETTSQSGYYTDGSGNSFVNNDTALDAAIQDGNTNVTLGSGNYIIPDSAQGKTLTIIGNGDTVVATQDDGSYEGCDYSLDGATVTFKGITINTDSTTYTGYARLKATYIDCTINGTYTLYDASTFENCTFNVSGDVYCIWTWGAPTATFTNCTFNTSGKAILLYGGTNTVLTVTDCTFNDDNAYASVNNKAAIEAGSDWSTDNKTIIATNCTVNGFDITTKGDNTGSTLWGDKNSLFSKGRLTVVIDGATYVNSQDGLNAAINGNVEKILLGAGEYELTKAKVGVTIKGVNEETVLVNATVPIYGFTGAIYQRMHFENLTFTNTISTFQDTATAETGGGSSTFTNVTFAAGFREGYGSAVVFTDCTFGSNHEGYALHFQYYAEGGLIKVNGCEFEGGKVHLGGTRTYEFVGCDFATGTDFQVWTNITLEGCTVDGVEVTADNLATLFPNLEAEYVTLK